MGIHTVYTHTHVVYAFVYMKDSLRTHDKKNGRHRKPKSDDQKEGVRKKDNK